MSLLRMNGNQAILDRTPPAEAVSESTAASARGPWLQLGSISNFEWNRYDLPITALPPALDGLRILHLSDLHLKSTWHPALDALHERFRHDEPDLIFITGDFVEDKFDGRRALPLVERFIGGLRTRFGTYAITGNHDGDLLAPRVAGWGVHVLPVAQPLRMTVRGADIELMGLAGIDRHDLHLQQVLDLAPREPGAPRVPRLVLSHYPNALVMLQRHGIVPDLFFAGHTHGGQVCLPGRVPILRHDTLPRRYCSGVHRLNESWLIVSRGMGFSSYPIRVFCPAEVVEVVLTPTPSPSGRGLG